ncbi:MAG: hypothetical protein M1838_002217 [Thelocarpon superellum]|nr:MAG: hypothetical protein M1838_002217 [Thelocarpon superellum]
MALKAPPHHHHHLTPHHISLGASDNSTRSVKRPKLSLQTTALTGRPIFGSASPSPPKTTTVPNYLSSSAVRNTLSSAYHHSPQRAFSPKHAHQTSNGSPINRIHLIVSPSSEPRYNQPNGLQSILCHSPLRRRRTPSSSLTTPTFSKPRTTSKKTISFSTPLEEEIHTTTYTCSHLRLVEEEAEAAAAANEWTADDETRSTKPPAFRADESHPINILAESETGVESRVARASKRDAKRKWVWTLDPTSEEYDGEEVIERVAAAAAQEKSILSPTDRA